MQNNPTLSARDELTALIKCAISALESAPKDAALQAMGTLPDQIAAAARRGGWRPPLCAAVRDSSRPAWGPHVTEETTAIVFNSPHGFDAMAVTHVVRRSAIPGRRPEEQHEFLPFPERLAADLLESLKLWSTWLDAGLPPVAEQHVALGEAIIPTPATEAAAFFAELAGVPRQPDPIRPTPPLQFAPPPSPKLLPPSVESSGATPRKAWPLDETDKLLVETIRKAGHRLTGEQIVSAAGLRDLNGHIKQKLATLRKAGVLDNRPDMSPPGYWIVGEKDSGPYSGPYPGQD